MIGRTAGSIWGNCLTQLIYLTAGAIRKLSLAKLPFIVGMSGFIDEKTRRATREFGMDAFLGKPFTHPQLIANLEMTEGFAVSA